MMSSEKNRSKERKRKIIKTARAGLLSKIVSVFASMIIVSIAVKYLGKEQYGLWVAISSLIAMFGFLDGGIGNSVVNLVAYASGSDTEKSILQVVSSAFFLLIIIAVTSFLLFLAIAPLISWQWIFGGIKSVSNKQLLLVVLLMGIFFCLNMVTSIVGKVQQGLQKGYLDHLWNGFGVLLSLVFVYFVIKKDLGFLWFVFAFLSGALSAYIGNNIFFFGVKKKYLRPQIKCVDRVVVKELFSVGGLFFILQIAASIQMQSDNIIIANLLGTVSVAEYAICLKLFTFVSMLYILALTPLWPAYREAIANGDVLWVQKNFRRSIKWALLIGVSNALLLILFGRQIIALWVGPEVVPSFWLLLGAGIWLVFLISGNAIAVLLNGLQMIKIQVIIAISAAVANIVVSILLIHLIGFEGAIYGTIISYLFCALIPYYFLIPKILGKLVLNKVSATV